MERVAAVMTFEEFERLPDEPGKCELLEGELIQLPPAMLEHMEIAHRLRDSLREWLGAKKPAGLGKVYVEMGYRLSPKTWLQPDVSITHVNQARGNYFEGGPALAIEIISESDTAENVDAKVVAYQATGSIEVWVLYPDACRMWKYRGNRAEPFTKIITTDLLPGVAIDLSDLLNV